MNIDPRVQSFVESMKIDYTTILTFDAQTRAATLGHILHDMISGIKQEIAVKLGCAYLDAATKEQREERLELLKHVDPVVHEIITTRYNARPPVELEVAPKVSQENQQSPINQALRAAAVDACDMLRKWSDSLVSTGIDDSAITPYKIGLFQDQLTQRFAEVYFGTHPALVLIDTKD